MTAITKTTPDWMSELFGLGFESFKSELGVDGLARIKGRRIDILAVVASKPRTGQVRAFIQACKDEYDTVRVYSVWNEQLEQALLRYGFSQFVDRENGEETEGYQWQR